MIPAVLPQKPSILPTFSCTIGHGKQYASLDVPSSAIDMRMTPMDLLLATLGPQAEYKPYKDSFYHGNTNAIDRFLNVVEAEKRGRDKLKSWLDV